jgi:hypothetical protein
MSPGLSSKMAEPEIRKLLVLSTAHMSPATLASIGHLHHSKLPFSGGAIDYGWFLYAHDEQPEGCPEDIWAACQFARSVAAEFIKFDCDGETVDGLPVFEHV